MFITYKISPAMRQGRNFRAGHLLDASGERTIFSMTEILSLSLLYGCNENMSIKNKKEVLKIVGTIKQSHIARKIMKNKKIRCDIYTRVFTTMQVDGYSLDAQKENSRDMRNFRIWKS